MNRQKTAALIFAIMGTMLITIGLSYSAYTYYRDGITENTIESGSIRFHYQEGNRNISITDAMPMDDTHGVVQENDYFDFTITSKTSSGIRVPYYITAIRKGNDNSLDGAVKLYLTEVSNKGENNESEQAKTLENNKIISKYSELSTYTNASLNITSAKGEKLLYIGEVPANSNNFSKDYRLRMWFGDNITLTQTETGSCSDSTYETEETCVAAHKNWTRVASATPQTFTLTVNVYSSGISVVENSGN